MKFFWTALILATYPLQAQVIFSTDTIYTEQSSLTLTNAGGANVDIDSIRFTVQGIDTNSTEGEIEFYVLSLSRQYYIGVNASVVPFLEVASTLQLMLFDVNDVPQNTGDIVGELSFFINGSWMAVTIIKEAPTPVVPRKGNMEKTHLPAIKPLYLINGQKQSSRNTKRLRIAIFRKN